MPSSAIEAVFDRYIELEREINRLSTAKFAAVCSECGGKCCRANQAAMTLESWWLRSISLRAHGKWWPDDWRSRGGCVAQGPTGCVLSAGRCVFCWAWLCEPLLAACENAWEVVFYVLLSELPGEIARLDGSMDLLQLDEAGVAEHLPLIARCVERAHGLLAEAKPLIDPAAGELDKHRIALHLLCLLPRLLHPLAQQAMLRRLPAAGSR